MHFITDCFIDWAEFQKLLIRHRFGKVLEFTPLPKRRAIDYLTKYLTKTLYNLEYPSDYGGRLWAASVKFLPIVSYSDSQGRWDLLWVDRAGDKILSMEKAFRLHYTDPSPPEYPWDFKERHR